MTTKIYAPTRENIELCGKLLSSGELVAFPTETVYGLGGNALDEQSARKIYEAKGRPSDNPLIVHVAKVEDIPKYVEYISDKAKLLIEHFMPGALTLVFRKNPIICNGVTGGLDTVGIRLPSCKLARDLIEASLVPVCAPSANTSSRPSPTTAKHVFDDLQGKITAILDGGECEIGLESTIVDVTSDRLRLLRKGGIPLELLESVVGNIEICDSGEKALAPGMKYKHYSPSVPVYYALHVEDIERKIIAKYDELAKSYKVVIIGLKGLNIGNRTFVSLGNNCDEYAHNMFEVLRELERDYDIILAQGVVDEGIGKAINNRMTKASGGKLL